MITNELLEILACPLTHEPLHLEDEKLVNKKWGINYPIRDGIPVLLIEQAEPQERIGFIEKLKMEIVREGP